MEKVTPETVRHVALLSRLNLSESEIGQFAGDLDAILGYVDKLKELDTSDVPPTSHSFRMENVFREDEVRPSLTNDEALSNAADTEAGCYKVPAVLQDGGGA